MRLIEFIKSAVHPTDYPEHNLPEVAILGRSNAGKSSFLNSIAGRKIAHVSKTPGKTRLLNFFNVGQSYVLVDLPGYGFASRGQSEIEQWSKMIEAYLLHRESLKVFVLVMDSRRDWSKDEESLKNLAVQRQVGFVVILTKADKLTKNESRLITKKIKDQCQAQEVFLISNLSNDGVKGVEDFIYRSWIKK